MSYSCFFEDASMEFPSYQLWLNKKITYQSVEPCTVVNINTFLEKFWVKEVRNVTKKILRQLSGYNQAGQERWCEAHFRTHL